MRNRWRITLKKSQTLIFSIATTLALLAIYRVLGLPLNQLIILGLTVFSFFLIVDQFTDEIYDSLRKRGDVKKRKWSEDIFTQLSFPMAFLICFLVHYGQWYDFVPNLIDSFSLMALALSLAILAK